MQNMKLLLFVALFLSFSLQSVASAKTDNIEFSETETAFIKTHPIIKVANEMDWPPFDYNEFGKPKGLSIDHITLLAKKAGLQIEFVNGYTWVELVKQFEQKKIDVLPGLYQNKEREAFTLFTPPYSRGKLGIFTHKQGLQISRNADLLGKRVGIQTSHGAIPIIQEQVPGIQFIEHPLPEALVKMLGTKKLDAIIGNPLLFYYFARENQITQIQLVDYIEMSSEEKMKTSLHVGVRSDFPVLHTILSKAMQAVTSQEMTAIENKWKYIQDEAKPKPVIALTPEEEAFVESHPTIRVSNELDFPPFDFAVGGQPQGYTIDLLNMLAERIRIKITYVNGYDWVTLVEMFKKGELDLLHTLNKTPKREKFGLYSDPFRRYRTQFISKKDRLRISNIEQLYGKVVAVGEGWSAHEYLASNYPQIQLLPVKNLEAMLDAVSQGDADATVNDNATARFMMKKQDIDTLRITGWFKEFDQGESRKFHFMAQKNAPELISMLNKALASLTPGDIDQLNKKWFGQMSERESKKEGTLALSLEEQTYLKKKDSIRLCIDPHWMPYEQVTKDGRHEGISADYFELFAQRIGVRIDLHVTQSWSETLNAVKNHQCDVLSLAHVTEERKAYMNFTTPYLSFPHVVATKNDKFFIEDIENELDKTFAVVRDYALVSELHQKYPEMKLIEVSSILEGLQKVQKNEVFGYIGATAVVAYTLQKEGILDIKVAGKLSSGFELGVATRNDEPLLHGIFQKAVDTLTQAEKRRIHNKWMAVKIERVVDYTLLWRIIAGGVLLFLLFAYWNRKLNLAKLSTEKALVKLEGAQQQLEQQNKTLEQLSITDSLTNVYNRAMLDKTLLNEFSRAARYNHSFSLILLDIDFFKEVNDTHGHQVGDQVLIEIAKLIKMHVRTLDTVGRWGGEEFLIISPETDQEGTMTLAEHLRKLIEDYNFTVVKHKTASFGVAVYQEGDTEDSLLARADKALYHAKANGRNCVELL